MIRPARLLALSLVLGATGCSRRDEPAPQGGATLAGAVEAPMTAPAAPQPAATGTPAAAIIPSAMRGRFGLVPADCTTTMGDDKGLITIGADSLKFYESVAKLTTATKATATHVEGTFAYEGEGMAWTRKAALDLSGNGKTLVLEEFGDDAVPGPRIYTRCPA